MSALTLEQVTFSYGERVIFEGLDLSVAAGTILVIAGPNGVGKSTLLHLMAGLTSPTTGHVSWRDTSLASLAPRARAQQIALSTEVEEMPFAWTAAEVVLMGRAPHRGGGYLDSKEDHARAEQALEALEVGALAERVFDTLSAGEKQRVMLARALAQETEILLLDEPTSHLDPAHTLHLVGLLQRLRDAGKLVVAVVHDLNVAAALADRLVFLTEAGIVADGAPEAVLVEEVVQRVYGVPCRRVGSDPPIGVFGSASD